MSCSSEYKTSTCNCRENQAKIVSLLKDNEDLLQIIRELKLEKQRLEVELRERNSAGTGSRSVRTAVVDDNKAEIQSLLKINHCWKNDYEELQMRYDMLSGEKRLLEDEEKELRERISELERRQKPLESEITKLASALYSRDPEGSDRSYEEHCEIVKTQVKVYKEDFERERRDREEMHEEKEKLKQELEDAEEIIKQLTTELDACKAREERERMHVRSEDGYLREREGLGPRHQVQLVLPYAPMVPMSDRRWRMEQHRRGILPRNPPPASFYYGGEVEVDH